MRVKNLDYIKRYIIENEIDISTFCKLCNITSDTFSKILEDKHISFVSYYKICKVLNVSLRRLQKV